MMRVGVIATAVAIILMAGMTYWTWSNLPEVGRIPVHYNGAGIADGWAANRNEAVSGFIKLMAISIVLALGCALAPLIDPARGGIAQSEAALATIWVGQLVLFTALTVFIGFKMVNAAESADPSRASFDTPFWIGLAMSSLTIVIGNVLPKTRPNFTIGIRTPWTLASANTWEKTHRLGGSIFVIAGLAGLAGAFVCRGMWAVYSGVTSTLMAGVICTAYSYFVWRNATDRNQAPRYLP